MHFKRSRKIESAFFVFYPLSVTSQTRQNRRQKRKTGGQIMNAKQTDQLQDETVKVIYFDIDQTLFSPPSASLPQRKQRSRLAENAISIR